MLMEMENKFKLNIELVLNFVRILLIECEGLWKICDYFDEIFMEGCVRFFNLKWYVINVLLKFWYCMLYLLFLVVS